MRNAGLLLVFVTFAAACSGGGGGGDNPTPTPTASPSPTATPATCTNPDAELVYVVDEVGDLHSFDPVAVAGTAHGFLRIGTVGCTPGPALAPFTDPAMPYSLALEEDATLWVLYTSGEIFRVSSQNAACTPTSFVEQQMAGGETWSLFGMAFVTDTSGGAAERIWISGGSPSGALGSLGWIDPVSLDVTRVGPMGGSAPLKPDLMGASDATLWGFFPGATSASVQQISKTNAALVGSASTFALGGGDSVSAWGSAHWGGSFWIFLTTTDTLGAANSTIRKIERSTGGYALVKQNLPFSVVAAGSSTCAPLN